MTLLLEPILIRTATKAGTSAGSVRIVWVTSLLIVGNLPAGGMTFQADGTPVVLTKFMANYMQSKIGDAWLADKFAKRLGEHGILSVSLHPGLMKTELQRHWILPQRVVMVWQSRPLVEVDTFANVPLSQSVIFKPCVYGAYSELYAGFSPDVTAKENGGHLTAWGRKAYLPKVIQDGLKSKSEGGTGAADQFFEYCDREVKSFL